MTDNQERADFEKWFTAHFRGIFHLAFPTGFERNDLGGYVDQFVEIMWTGWQGHVSQNKSGVIPTAYGVIQRAELDRPTNERVWQSIWPTYGDAQEHIKNHIQMLIENDVPSEELDFIAVPLYR